jgi:hypothetical protein
MNIKPLPCSCPAVQPERQGLRRWRPARLLDLLDRLLDHVRFDPACDRLFSVGDLIDRGPDSLRSLEFLEAPWFYAVKGNHEDLLLEFFEPYRASGRMDYWDEILTSDLRLNGGEWVEACYCRLLSTRHRSLIGC